MSLTLSGRVFNVLSLYDQDSVRWDYGDPTQSMNKRRGNAPFRLMRNVNVVT